MFRHVINSELSPQGVGVKSDSRAGFGAETGMGFQKETPPADVSPWAPALPSAPQLQISGQPSLQALSCGRRGRGRGRSAVSGEPGEGAGGLASRDSLSPETTLPVLELARQISEAESGPSGQRVLISEGRARALGGRNVWQSPGPALSGW